MKKRTHVDWISFLVGAFMATWICILIYTFCLPDKASTETSTTSTETSTEATKTGDDSEVREDGSTLTAYNTGIKEWKFNVDDKELTFNTPEGFYSLSDQYLENISEYYGVENLTSDTIAMMGDNSELYSSNTVISVDVISDVANIMKQIYGDDFNEDELVTSEAYTYMTTGELGDDLPLNFEIDEVGTYEVDGVTFKSYNVQYDTEYATSESVSENATEDVTTVHTQQLVCYSDTEDPIEIVIYQTNFNREEAVNYLKEFLGVK